MNDYTRKIWQAWIDGEDVQFNSPYCDIDNKWLYTEPPSLPPDLQPHNCPERWRVNQSKWFRVYFNSKYGTPEFSLVEKERLLEWREKQVEKMKHFQGWLTDWIQYEIREEEQ